MESQKIGKEIMDGQFIFKTEKVVVCQHCKREFQYHRSSSSLSYHLRTKHAFTARGSDRPKSPVGVNQRQPTLVALLETNQQMERGKNDAITNAIAHWIAMNGRPINIVLRSARARQVSPALSQMLRGSRVAAGRRMTRMSIGLAQGKDSNSQL